MKFKEIKFVDSCPITDDSLTSYQSLEGKWVIPMEYKNVFYPDDCGFMKVYDGYHWGLYDSDGNEVFPIIYDDIYYDKGLDTRTGKIVIPAIYDRIEMASKDMLTASLGIENVESVVFDINGRQHK